MKSSHGPESQVGTVITKPPMQRESVRSGTVPLCEMHRPPGLSWMHALRSTYGYSAPTDICHGNNCIDKIKIKCFMKTMTNRINNFNDTNTPEPSNEGSSYESPSKNKKLKAIFRNAVYETWFGGIVAAFCVGIATHSYNMTPSKPVHLFAATTFLLVGAICSIATYQSAQSKIKDILEEEEMPLQKGKTDPPSSWSPENN